MAANHDNPQSPDLTLFAARLTSFAWHGPADLRIFKQGDHAMLKHFRVPGRLAVKLEELGISVPTAA
jgi:hypothetical protein